MSQEFTTQSWFARIKNAFFGVIIGLVLIGFCIYGIFWNESTGLHTAQSYKQTEAALISVPTSPINQSNNMKVVYFTGDAQTPTILTDNLFHISLNAIRLTRHVEMYQWKEEQKSTSQNNLGGSETTTTTYSYNKEWSPRLINSDNFHDRLGHENPSEMPVASHTTQSLNVNVGDFKLPQSLINKIGQSHSVSVENVDLNTLQTQLNKPASRIDNLIYAGKDSNNPQIGDLRITFNAVLPPKPVSIIAQQTGSTLQPYMAPAGKPIELLSMGTQSSQQMIQQALSENEINTWMIRFGTLIGLILGFALLLQPIVILTDVMPLLGRIVGFGTGLIAFVAGLSLWAIFTAIAWFAVRPLIAIALVVVIAALVFALIKRKHKTLTTG